MMFTDAIRMKECKDKSLGFYLVKYGGIQVVMKQVGLPHQWLKFGD